MTPAASTNESTPTDEQIMTVRIGVSILSSEISDAREELLSITAKLVARSVLALHPTATSVRFSKQAESDTWCAELAIAQCPTSTVAVDIGLIDSRLPAILTRALPHAWAATGTPWFRARGCVTLSLHDALTLETDSAHDPFNPISRTIFAAVQALTARPVRALTISTTEHDNGWFFDPQVGVTYSDGDEDEFHCDAIDERGSTLSALTSGLGAGTELTIDNYGERVTVRG